MLLAALLGCVFLFLIGLLVGWSMAEIATSQRSRRQAEIQRRLNEQWRALGEFDVTTDSTPYFAQEFPWRSQRATRRKSH